MSYKVVRGYRHTQSTPSTTWSINHKLGELYPVVDVYVDDNGTMTKILPNEIEVIDANNLELTFSSAIAGSAEVL